MNSCRHIFHYNLHGPKLNNKVIHCQFLFSSVGMFSPFYCFISLVERGTVGQINCVGL